MLKAPDDELVKLICLLDIEGPRFCFFNFLIFFLAWNQKPHVYFGRN